MADRGAGRLVGGRVGRTLAVALALVATLFAGSAGSPVSVSAATDTNPEFTLLPADLEFILKQIQIAEAHAAGGDLLCGLATDTSGKCVPDPMLPLGLRTVDGSYNNLEFNEDYGAAHHPFPRLLTPVYRDGVAAPEGAPPNPPGTTSMCADPAATCYGQTTGFVYDPEPRMISNLIVDQTTANPAAVAAANAHSGAEFDPATGANSLIDTGTGNIFLPNTTADEELSAPFNAWFTFFGQFFDHGLDLVEKGGNGTVIIPLQEDDPLWDVTPENQRFMMVSRSTNQPDGTKEHDNLTTPFVDQNQTYTSHPAHQVFLREYELVNGRPEATGRLLDAPGGGLATWNDIKTQARDVLGIALGLEPGTDPGPGNSDYPDVLNVPQIVVDEYGNFEPGPSGFPQMVTTSGPAVEGNPAAPISTADAARTGHAFLDDIAHGASLDPADLSGYDNVLLGQHFITGDGRGNENIALTAVHHVFHSEHNRMVGAIEEILSDANTNGPLGHPNIAELRNAFMGLDHSWEPLMGDPLPQPEGDDWSYEQRLFQAAKFATEMQYQHLVFEEFARRIQPEIDAVVLNENSYDSTIDPSIVAEFAHVVYRFGHSMLTEDVHRDLDLNGDGAVDDTEVTDASLFDAFLNPVSYLCPVPPVTDAEGLSSCPQPLMSPDQAAGAIVNGTTNQVGNQIDEFVTDVLRNQLLGLPLDLPAINMARARDAGVPGLQAARRTFFAESNDPRLEPYTSWADFDLGLKNGNLFGRGQDSETLVNFVAAYGTHPSVTGAPDLAGRREAASLLVNGSTAADFTTRIAGVNRYATAVAISQAEFQPGVPVVYIANGTNFPDALAGGPAAAAAGGPILLVERNSIPAATANELARLQPGRIVVLGGTAVVTNQVLNSLQTYTEPVPPATPLTSVTRLAGADRFATAAAISADAFPNGSSAVYIATGADFPDALAGAAVAARDGNPILLVAPDSVPAATLAELNRLNPTDIYVLGGTSAISQDVETVLEGLAPNVVRYSGATRYETAVAISFANFDPATTDTVLVSTGANFPDALAAAVIAGMRGAPLLLVPPTGEVPQVVIDEITRLGLGRAPAGIHVLGGASAVSQLSQDELEALAPPDDTPPPADRLAFMNSTGTWAPDADGLTTTGLEDVDFWIGGLAEALDPFGGMLGPTFNHVFEEQLENLQFGDRFYYLFRNQGNQLFAGLENNSFASLIRRNTDADFIPADIFAIQDPYFELGNLPTPLPPGLLDVGNCYQWQGDEHIEIHGTPAPDCIIGGQGDDSLWGYAGEDRIEGGSGNDTVIAGGEDDIVTDSFGDDNLKGGWGDDALDAGPGDDLITASHGDDFIVKQAGPLLTAFAGTGDDIILGGTGRDNVFGGEGDDWMEGGEHADLLMGDNANQFQADPNGGHDVLKGGPGSDDHDSDGGDDIMVGNAGGTDRIEGMMGFDWVTYYGEIANVDVDLRFSVLQRPDIQAIRDRFDFIEGASGGAGNDILRGLGVEQDDIPDEHIGRHRLSEEHIDRIGGFEELLRPDDHVIDYSLRFMPNPLTPDFDGVSNPLFGGPGSDLIEGRGGNDFLDGDLVLRVRLGVGVGTATAQFYDSAAQLREAVFAGTVDPGDVQIVRDLADLDEDGSHDTALYNHPVAEFLIRDRGDHNGDGVHYYEIEHVAPEGGEFEESDGIDVIRNFEELRFVDGCLTIEQGVDPSQWVSCTLGGTVTLDTLDPVEDSPITATLQLDGVTVAPTSIIQYNWQIGDPGRNLEASPNDVPETVSADTNTFIPGDEDAGRILRVVVTFVDSAGVLRQIGSETTNEIVNLDDAGVAPTLVPLTPTVGGGITGTGFTDADGLEFAEPLWIWEATDDGGTTITELARGTNLQALAVTAAYEGLEIRVRIEYTDDADFDGEVISEWTAPVQSAGP